MVEAKETVPCTICGDPTWMLGTKLCDACWEFDHRVDYILRDAKPRYLRELRDKIERTLQARG